MNEEMASHQSPPQFLSVNASGYESSLDKLAEEGTLPILQDELEIDMWDRWQITYRDVVVVDENLKPIARINLTDNSLSDEPVYNALLNLIKDVIQTPAP